MSTEELIRERRSVRTFDGNDLRAEDAERILLFAETADNPYGISIEWRLLSAKEDNLNSAVIVGADTFIAGKTERAPHAEEAFGYSFERIVLFAQSLGVGTTWIAGTMDREAFEQAVDLQENEVMPCVSPLGYPARKMSLRETVMRKGVKADSRMEFSELFFAGSFDRPLTEEEAGDLRKPLEMVRLAPSAVNKQPWRAVIDGDRVHFYEQRTKGYVDENGWDLQKIDLGIALCHFACAIEDEGRKAEFVTDDPGIELPGDVSYIASYIVR